MRHRRQAVLVLAPVAALLLFAWASVAEDAPAAATEVVVLYSGNVEGEIEPCGCTEGMLGGLARRATVVAGLRADGCQVIQLDSGDLYFRREPIPEVMRPQLSLKAETIGRLYRDLGCDALALGELDLALGDEVHARAERARDGEPLAPGAGVRVREVDGLRVGIVGIGHRDRAGDLEQAVSAEPVDLLVCVSHLGQAGDERLAGAIPAIDVIVGGHDGAMLERPLRAGRTLIVQTGTRGRFLGRLTLHLRPDWRGAGLFDASENERWRGLTTEYDAVVERFTRERDAATAPGDRERAQANVELYRKEAAEARARVRDLSDRSWFANRLIPLDKRIPDDPAVARAVEEYKKKAREVNEALAESLAATPKQGPAFVGGASCVGCHGEEHEGWSRTPHARAFDTLVRRGQEMDLECVGCHSTAFQEGGGFFLPAKVGDWKGVQCEACHGPGEGHPPRRLAATPSRDACVRCHQAPQHEGFDYERSLPLTGHER